MMKFERVFEDGEFEIFRSTNHSDKNRAGEIIHDWDAGTWAAIVIDPVDPVGDGWIENLGEFDSADMAARHLECEVTHRLVVGPDALVVQRAVGRRDDLGSWVVVEHGPTEQEKRKMAFMF